MSQSYKLQKKSFMKHYIIVVVFDCAKVFIRQKFYGIIDNKFWLMFLSHYVQCNPFHRVFYVTFNIFHNIQKVIMSHYLSWWSTNSVNQKLIINTIFVLKACFIFTGDNRQLILSVESFCILKWKLELVERKLDIPKNWQSLKLLNVCEDYFIISIFLQRNVWNNIISNTCTHFFPQDKFYFLYCQ